MTKFLVIYTPQYGGQELRIFSDIHRVNEWCSRSRPEASTDQFEVLELALNRVVPTDEWKVWD